MDVEVVFILLFAVAAAVAIVARRFKVPYTVALVVAGLLLGELHALQPPLLTRTLLFSIFLPGLVFEAAYHLEFTDFRRNALPIGALALPGVVLSMLVTAAGVTPLIQSLRGAPVLDWNEGLLFGAIISATDPIAVVSLFRRLGAPRRLSIIMEGESLLNDGTAVVLFTIILAVVLGTGGTLATQVASFVAVVGGGVVVGAGIGFTLAQVIRRIDEPMIEITLTTIAAWGSFALADLIGASGVIATVAAGMVSGSYAARTGMSPSTRVAVETFWEYIAFALNSIVFLLIGFAVRRSALLASAPAIIAAYVVVMIARALLVGGVRGLVSRRPARFTRRWGLVLTWGGLRGGVAMVLALGLPETVPGRDTLVVLTYGVVLLSLVVNGLTMAPLLRRLGLARKEEDWQAHETARGALQAANAALAELEKMQRQRLVHPVVIEHLREEYDEQIHAAEQRLETLHQERADLREEELRSARRHLLLVEKTRVMDAFRTGALSQDAHDRLLADIDARMMRLDDRAPDEPPERT